MRIVNARITSDCDIALQGDDHEGARNFHEHGVEQMLDWVTAERGRYYCKMGDVIESITTDDKRFSLESSKEPIPLQQAASAIKRHNQGAKRALVWLGGNHEGNLHRFGDLSAYMAHEIGVQYGGRVCKLVLHDKHGPVCKFFLIHPSGVSISSTSPDHERRIANMKYQVKNRLVNKACDCIVMAMGHVHKLIVCDPPKRLVLRDDGKDVVSDYLEVGDSAGSYIEPDRRFYCATGSMLKLHGIGYDGYAECAMYDPIELGYPIVEIRDRKVVGVRKVLV